MQPTTRDKPQVMKSVVPEVVQGQLLEVQMSTKALENNSIDELGKLIKAISADTLIITKSIAKSICIFD